MGIHMVPYGTRMVPVWYPYGTIWYDMVLICILPLGTIRIPFGYHFFNVALPAGAPLASLAPPRCHLVIKA